MDTMATPTFDDLLIEGNSVPTEGWDFSWFDGRATEERPSWGYLTQISDRMTRSRAALDLQTGGGEVLAKIPTPPPVLAATESWEPNLEVARRNLAEFNARVEHAPDEGPLPFSDASFDLVVSRHPVTTPWEEIARVLQPGGTFLSQQVGPETLRELSEAIMGPIKDYGTGRQPTEHAALAEAAGMRVIDLREETLRCEFFDIAAVIHFLRKVIWIVPGFTVERYRPQLEAVHRTIGAEGSFIAHTGRFLIEARR